MRIAAGGPPSPPHRAPAPARTHLQNAYAALGVNNSDAAVAAAFGKMGAGIFTG